jgi:hypothetical protein
VTCLCPTYGRFQLLREALACFLAQDYPGEKRLLILNDADRLIHVPEVSDLYSETNSLTIVHDYGQYTCLGQKRQFLLHRAETPLVAHWDDDDLYLPWHLSRSVAALLDRGTLGPSCASRAASGREGWGCVKSRGAWYMTGPRGALQNNGIHHNVFEGSMVFWRDEALALGGYPPLHSGQAKALMDSFAKAGRLFSIPDDYAPLGAQDRQPTAVSPATRKAGKRQQFPAACCLPPAACSVSYVYRWAQGCGHISPIGNTPESLARFQAQNTDFGDGWPLTPADLSLYWQALNLSCPSQAESP